jgi:hypothetical protein
MVEHDFELIKEIDMLKKALIKVNEENDIENRDKIESRIEQINSELYTDEYNVAKYLDAFNKKVKPLLVCFHLDIRSKILLDIVKNKDKVSKKVTEKLKDRIIFTRSECGLVSGMPYKEVDQDSYEELMTMEDKEIIFWNRVNKIPNNMEENTWEDIRADYHERMRIAKENGVKAEKEALEDIFKHLEISDLNSVLETLALPIDVFIICDITNDSSGMLISRKWGEPLCHYYDIFKYEKEAIERNKFYNMKGCLSHDNRYQQYVDYIAEQRVMTGLTETIETNVVTRDLNGLIDKLKEKADVVISTINNDTASVKKKNKLSETLDDDDDDDIEEDEDGNIIRNNEEIQLDDEFDDTFSEIPDDYVAQLVSINGMDKEEEILQQIEKEDVEDEWGF